ncbi:hypothetical protein [Allostreptomyces psammosilenae]|uniref:Uncharacterized protein n=1 Tax=Allostreptomyces psammosilenae TaxID=1892865 RepID=A0A853A5U6_9ACTN|nr:hypothetical protein [Allostreptomyces psammosilenae]NYI06061.1 hypothetical protein [Allostreptomyces psammosilenae]
MDTQYDIKNTFRRGDLAIVVTSHGQVYAGQGCERVGEDLFRVWISMRHGDRIFDSSVDVRSAEVRQIVRNGVVIWTNRD